MGLLRRSAAPDRLPSGLSMKLDSTFFVGRTSTSKPTAMEAALARKAPGTILLGELVGEGTLKPGDVVICAAGRFPIKRIEAFKQILERVDPPRNIGLALGPGVDKDLFRDGEELRFER
jgi:hypothetical protein